MTGTRAVIAAVGVALALGVSACSGGDPEPRVAPSTAPTSPSTTAASDPIAPTMPPEAKGSDAAAAEAFVKFYWEMVNYAQETGDVAPLSALGERCTTCDKGAKSIAKVYDTGGEIRGGSGSLSQLQTHFLAGKSDRAVVEFTLSNTRQVVDYPGTSRDVQYPAGDLAFQFLLHRVTGGWHVLFLGEQ